MPAVQKWNSLQPARVDSTPDEHRMIHIADARIDIRIRIEFQEMRDHELCSSEVDEPITDDGDLYWFHFRAKRFVSTAFVSTFAARDSRYHILSAVNIPHVTD